MKKVFFISNCNFPRGNPMANYIQYFMLAVKMAGYEPILISTINDEFISCRSDHITYKGLSVLPIEFSSNRVIRHFEWKYKYPYELVRKLKRQGIDSEDVVFLYGENRIISSRLLSLRKRIKFKIIGGVAELFEKKDFADNVTNRFLRKPDRIYRNFMYIINKLYTQFDLIVPISKFIDQYFQERGTKTELIPIMADSYEYERKEKHFDKYRFVLPAHGKMKDDLISMLKAFAMLNDEQLAKIELHLCGGVKEKRVKEILSLKEYERLKPAMVFYEWMKYDELIALYQKMHFLILARKTSQMTLANFPSKVPETMNFGIVPVVSDVGDYTKYYLRKDIDSIFIDGFTSKACYEALCKAISLSKEEYLGYSGNAILCVKEKFDYRVWAPKIKTMLDGLY